jgi:hypothetical protein
LFAQGYTTSLNQVFLSPLGDSYHPSPYCETIPVSSTGAYLATQSGVWEGEAGFLYSEATYEISVTSLPITYDEYSLMMVKLYNQLLELGSISQNQDLGMNMLYWFVYSQQPINGNDAQLFYLLGDPQIVFQREQIIGTLSSRYGICNVSTHSDFDAAEGLLITDYNVMEYGNDSICNNTVPSTNFDHLPGTNVPTFSINIDVRTLVTGVAVNMNITSFTELTEILQFQNPYEYDNIMYNASHYYNRVFPGMDQLVCLTNPSVHQCIIRVSSSLYAIPFFHHIGSSTEYPMPCNCSIMSPTEKADQYHICNSFKFLAGFIFYPNSHATPDLLFELILKFNMSFTTINEYAYEASFWSSYWGKQSPYYNESQQQDLFEFCNLQNGTYCSIMSYAVFDSQQSNWAISEYYFQLSTGACQDTFSTDWNYWEKLIEIPFTRLIQQYEQCTSSPSTILLSQIGIQIGNLSVITPFVVMIILLLVYIYQITTGTMIPKAYSRKEKDDALEAFAISLLLARDRKRRFEETQRLLQEQKQRINMARLFSQDGDCFENNLIDQDPENSNVHDDDEDDQNEHHDDISQTQNELWKIIDILEKDTLYHEDCYQLKAEQQKNIDKLIAMKKIAMKKKHKVVQYVNNLKTNLTNPSKDQTSLDIINPLNRNINGRNISISEQDSFRNRSLSSESNQVELSNVSTSKISYPVNFFSNGKEYKLAIHLISQIQTGQISGQCEIVKPPSEINMHQLIILNKSTRSLVSKIPNHTQVELYIPTVVKLQTFLALIESLLHDFKIVYQQLFSIDSQLNSTNQSSKNTSDQTQYWTLVGQTHQFQEIPCSFLFEFETPTSTDSSAENDEKRNLLRCVSTVFQELMQFHAACHLNIEISAIDSSYFPRLAYLMQDRLIVRYIDLMERNQAAIEERK